MRIAPRYLLRIGDWAVHWISPHAAWAYSRYPGYVVERIA